MKYGLFLLFSSSILLLSPLNARALDGASISGIRPAQEITDPPSEFPNAPDWALEVLADVQAGNMEDAIATSAANTFGGGSDPSNPAELGSSTSGKSEDGISFQ